MAMTIEPSGATVRFAVYASHSSSVKIRLSSPVRSTMVTMLAAARFWMLTFHVKYINSGSCYRDTPISPAVRLVCRTLVVEDMVFGLELNNTVVVFVITQSVDENTMVLFNVTWCK